MDNDFDIVIQDGLFFDGTGTKPEIKSVGIKDGLVAKISDSRIDSKSAKKVIEAKGLYVMPGFIDFHTHYDAEIEASPALGESLRHGVTTVTLGSCSLSLAIGTPEDLADMFSRVEAIPREHVLPLLEKNKTWNSLSEYVDHLKSLPLGPNVSSFIGHSALRAYTMGLQRSLQKGEKPSAEELSKMDELLESALDAGYLGMSINTLRWDKMDGNRYRSKPLPSTFATWSEYRHFTKMLRKRKRIFQGVPNVSSKYNVLFFLWESVGLFRQKLKTTIISLMDVRSNRLLYRLVANLVRIFNSVFRADIRLQALPEMFDLYADGVDVVVFEEFGAGTAAIHLQDMAERKRLLKDKDYRKWFRKQWTNWFLPRVFHRNFRFSEIVSCPDKSIIGKSFQELAEEQGKHVVDIFLDLCAEYGNDLRWYTVIGNDRKKPLEYIVSHPDILIGFSDAGAHLRGMAHYNFPLRMLKLVRDAEIEGRPFMPMEKAVWRLTGEIADWFGLDAGTLKVGKRADLAIINPEGLDDSLEAFVEESMPEMGGLTRLVRRNNKAVQSVIVNGKLAVENGEPLPNVGKEKGFGTFLRALDPVSA